MRLKKVTLGLVLLLGAAVVSAPTYVRAMGNDEATLVTFNQPVEVPGLVLPAGEYLFKSIGPVVQIWDSEQTKLYTTLMTIPAYRRDADDNPAEFTFEERAAGAPMGIEAWYYDGGSIGQEFVYKPSK